MIQKRRIPDVSEEAIIHILMREVAQIISLFKAQR